MCRLFGLHAGDAVVPATFWLIDAPDSLAAQSRRNPDGTGLGSFGSGGVATLLKQPMAAWQDEQFGMEAHELRGTTFVAHIRYATTGGLVEANTHPFLQDGRMLAHNGVVHGLDRLDARLAILGGTDLVRGDTDSERIFALITAETRDHGGDVTAGLTAAVRWVGEELPIYAINLVLITPTDLWALRYPGTHQLHVLHRPAGGTGTGRELDARTSRIHARSTHLAAHPSVVVASEPMDDDPAWRALAPGELLRIREDLSAHSSQPIPPPRHQLRRSDLGPIAAAAQHPEQVPDR